MTIVGNIEEVRNDSVVFKMNRIVFSKSFEQEGEEIEYEWNTASPIKVVSKYDILQLKNYKSSKKKRLRKNISVTGGILLFGGLLTGVNALVFQKKAERNSLLLVGGIQAGTGLILGISSATKRHRFQSTDDPWKFN